MSSNMRTLTMTVSGVQLEIVELRSKDQDLTKRIYDLFDVKDASPEETKIFRDLTHDDLLKSLKK